MTTKQTNVRSLCTIADDIHKLERKSITDIGDLLLEAKAQCEHGQWLDWLGDEFDWSVDTAERYMKVAKLSSKFRTLRNLKLAVTTLYELADHDNEEELPSIVSELSKHASKKKLPPRDAERVIKVGIGRHRFGDHPDAALVRLAELNEWGSPSHSGIVYEKAATALQERNPETDEAANSIVNEITQAYYEAELLKAEEKAQRRDEIREEAEQEADAILDGAPPDLPPPITPPEPQRLDADSDWAETKPFVDAVKGLIWLHAKPISRFVGMFSPAVLREMADFLMAVAAAQQHADTPHDGIMPDIPACLDRRSRAPACDHEAAG
jgi:hypothetical protein